MLHPSIAGHLRLYQHVLPGLGLLHGVRMGLKWLADATRRHMYVIYESVILFRGVSILQLYKYRHIQVLDAISGDELLTFTGHHGNVYSVNWSPDGTKIASGSGWNEEGDHDYTARVIFLLYYYIVECRKLMIKSPN